MINESHWVLRFWRRLGIFQSTQLPFFQREISSSVLIPFVLIHLLKFWRFNWVDRGGFPIILSSHTLVPFPFLGSLDECSLMRGRAILTRFQTWEHGLIEDPSRRRDQAWFIYLYSRTFFNQQSFPVINLHVIFSPRAKFKWAGSLMDMPPFSQGKVTWSHFTKLNFFYSGFPPFERNHLIINSICLWMFARAKIVVNW